MILVAFWYFQAAGDLAERGRALAIDNARWRFFGGLLAVELAVQSSVAMLPYISFPMHVVQMLLLVVVAAPLLVLGTPVPWRWRPPAPRTRRRLLAATGSAPARVLLHPAVSFVLLFVGLLAYFLTAALAASMRHVWLLNLINLGFLAAGPVLLVGGPRHRCDRPTSSISAGQRLALLAGAIVLESVLGIALVARTKPVADDLHLDRHPPGRCDLVGGGRCWPRSRPLIAVFTEWNRGDESLGPADEP